MTGDRSSFLPSEGGLLPSFGGGGPPTRRGRWEEKNYEIDSIFFFIEPVVPPSDMRDSVARRI